MLVLHPNLLRLPRVYIEILLFGERGCETNNEAFANNPRNPSRQRREHSHVVLWPHHRTRPSANPPAKMRVGSYHPSLPPTMCIKGLATRKNIYCAVFRKEYTAQGGPGTEITDAIPSLDMRPVLALFSPEDAFLRIESCTGCGGHLEIVTKETKRVARLTKRIRYGM